MTPAIFLSASLPLPDRHPKYFESVDVIAVRDSIRALVTVVIPKGKIVFGGHPAITPMMRLLIKNIGVSVKDSIVLFQSRFFQGVFPAENSDIETVVLTDAEASLEASLRKMRLAMIASEQFVAAFFIGGMEGVEEEYHIFREIHPNAPAYPIASTGAAAKLLFERYHDNYQLLSNLRYLSLFRHLLNLGDS